MMNEKQIKQQFRKIGKLLSKHNGEREQRAHNHNYIFEEGLLFGAWLAYDSVLETEK
uniref:Uncharacterized protein n=1 Tax=viral metagenome TaxID=1070528 RepID=A0A6M3LAP5_9ZZZZ